MAHGMFSNFFRSQETALSSDVAPTLPPVHDYAQDPQFRYLLDCLPANVMYCDTELILRYLNKSSRQTLQKLAQYLPVKIDEIVGKSIHIFHKHPERAESILGGAQGSVHPHGNPHAGHPHRQLPYRAVISLGPEKLDLQIEGVHDAEGQYIGAVVVWGVTTAMIEKVRKEGELLKEGVAAVDNQLQKICSSTEEINHSIQEIAKSAQSVELASAASKDAGLEGLKAIRNLQDSSEGVAKVASLISDIATQTSVLALNATIEAARAGEHGKGFSVVAGEVKKLSEQTAHATKDIQSKVTAIRNDLGNASKSISQINDEVSELNNVAQMLASATEEQRAATAEMMSNLDSAAKAAFEIANVHMTKTEDCVQAKS